MTDRLATKNHFTVLDSFRGLCACLVAISHFHANSIFQGSSLFDRGAIWVDFFFVLSGFVIFANYREKLQSGYHFGKFIYLRFARLYPLHIAVFLAFILIDILQIFVHVDGASLYKPFSAPGEDMTAIVANLFLVHSLGVVDTLSFNGPSWSISVEFYTYILFALILIYSGKYYRHVVALALTSSAVFLYFHHDDLFAKLDYGFFRCVYGFGCGALTWEIYQKFQQKYAPILNDKIKSNLLEVGVLAFCLTYVAFFSFDVTSFFAPLVFGLVIFFFAFEAGVLSKIFKYRFFVFLGMLSYSIYMNHIFISGKLFALPVRLLEGRTDLELTIQSGNKNLYGQTPLTGTLLELFYLSVVVGCSYISYKVIEEPFRNWAKKRLRKTETQK